jgi:hypothetical protein
MRKLLTILDTMPRTGERWSAAPHQPQPLAQ